MYGAVDVGGTKTLIALLDEKGSVMTEYKFPTPKNYEEFVTTLKENAKKISTDQLRVIGFAVPGKINRKAGVGLVFGNLPWENVPIQADAEKIFRCPIIVENDANLAGLSEARLLGNKYDKVLYVTVSTGIGGGFITGGNIDPRFADAEIGHILLEHDGRLQRWEDFASGSAIVEKFGKRASEIEDPRTWYVVARNIAIGLIDLIATLTPDIIVIGGGVGSHFDKFSERLTEHLKIYENPMLTIPPVVAAKNAETAVVYGCYEIAKDYYESTHR